MAVNMAGPNRNFEQLMDVWQKKKKTESWHQSIKIKETGKQRNLLFRLEVIVSLLRSCKKKMQWASSTKGITKTMD